MVSNAIILSSQLTKGEILCLSLFVIAIAFVGFLAYKVFELKEQIYDPTEDYETEERELEEANYYIKNESYIKFQRLIEEGSSFEKKKAFLLKDSEKYLDCFDERLFGIYVTNGYQDIVDLVNAIIDDSDNRIITKGAKRLLCLAFLYIWDVYPDPEEGRNKKLTFENVYKLLSENYLDENDAGYITKFEKKLNMFEEKYGADTGVAKLHNEIKPLRYDIYTSTFVALTALSDFIDYISYKDIIRMEKEADEEIRKKVGILSEEK